MGRNRTNVDEPVVENIESPAEEPANVVIETEDVTTGGEVSVDAVIKNLVAKGCKKYKARIKNVTVTKKINSLNQDYAMISFTLDRKVPRFIENEDGDYEEKMSNIIFTTHIGVNAVLKEKTEMGVFAATLIKEAVELPTEEKLKRIVLLLGGANVEFLQELVPAETEYINPFSQQEDPEATVFDHDQYISHITNIQFGPTGKQALLIAVQAVML